MSAILKPGTWCLTTDGNPLNQGRVVVVEHLGTNTHFDPIFTFAYFVRTASGKSFKILRRFHYGASSEPELIRDATSECIADRRHLRPLENDPTVESDGRADSARGSV